MATNNFQLIEPLFYNEFTSQYPAFHGWALERMPRNVNTRRIVLDEFKMSKGWLYESYNTRGQFSCIKCIKTNNSKSSATWSSAYTTVLFRAYAECYTDWFGQLAIGGLIQMKIYAQQCKRCDEYITPAIDDVRAGYLVKWIHRWIANKFYGYPPYRSYYQGQQTGPDHLQDRCEACRDGWCYYLRVHNR